MVFVPIQSLQDLCGIRIAYLMWARHKLFKRRAKEHLFEDFLDDVLTEIQSLPVPEKMKSLVLKHVKPAGKHLISFLALWFSKLQSRGSQKWLTVDMLMECLILNGHGLINYRKTAEKLLHSRMLNNVVAFRLACINFLEEDVLKLWPFVKKYFLNKIALESEQGGESDSFPSDEISRPVRPNNEIFRPVRPNNDFFSTVARFIMLFGDFSHSVTVKESEEVLYWISYCVSKENAIEFEKMPHFKGSSADWLEEALRSARRSGNAACFDYFYIFRNPRIKYNDVRIMQLFFAPGERNREQQCFILHFLRLDHEQKTELFRKYTRRVVSHFLQWPLSLTFVENTEELWSLIPEEHRKWVLVKIFANLFHDNAMILPFRSRLIEYNVCVSEANDLHSVDHLENIWVALWKKSSDTDKSPIFDYFVFPSIMCSQQMALAPINSNSIQINSLRYFEVDEEFVANFSTSGLKEKLIHLFLTHGEAILELYAGTDRKESLERLIAKYMPEGFGDGDRRYIPVRPDYIPTASHVPSAKRRNIPKYSSTLVDKSFLDYIKSCLFSSDSIDKSFFLSIK